MTEEEKFKKQLQDYKDAVEATRVELRQLRTEKAQAAQTTLAQLQKDIPVLEAKSRELRAVLADLEKKIEARDLEYRRQNEDLSARYSELEAGLKAEYSVKQSEIQVLIEKNKALSEDFAVKNKEVFNREVMADKRYEELKRLEASLVERRDALNSREKAINDSEARLNMERDRVNALFSKKTVELSDKEEYMNRRIKECTERELRASEIIDQVNDIQGKINKNMGILNSQEQKEADIRALEIRLAVQKQELQLKENQLINRETELDEREENIKKLEKKVPI